MGPIMAGTRTVTVWVDVSGIAPEGRRQVAADLFVPAEIDSMPALWCCVPGGGMSRRYFDLEVPAPARDFSMAMYAADRGHLVLIIDPPGEVDRGGIERFHSTNIRGLSKVPFRG